MSLVVYLAEIERHGMYVLITEDLHKKIKLSAIHNNKTIQHLIQEILEEKFGNEHK